MNEMESPQNSSDMGSVLGLLCAGGILFALTILTVLLAQLRFDLWIIFVALLSLIVQVFVFARSFSEGKKEKKLSTVSYIPSILMVVFFLFVITTEVFPRNIIQGVGSRPAGESQPEEIPFEILHGYGPIKEIIEVGALDTLMAKRGESIFDSKCGTCHKLDDRYTGPPLRYVTNYRSATFIMNQILDPAQNVAKHPHMQEMLKMYYTYMTNQNVTAEEARILVEYLRWESGRGEE